MTVVLKITKIWI